MGGRGDHASCCRHDCQVFSGSSPHAASYATATAQSQSGRGDPRDDPTAVVVDDGAPKFSRGCISVPQDNLQSHRDRRDDGSTTSSDSNSEIINARSCSSSGRRVASGSNRFLRNKGGKRSFNASSSRSSRRTTCCGDFRSYPTRPRRKPRLLRRQRESAVVPCCRRRIGAVVAIAATVAGLFGSADAQYKTGTALYEDNMDIAEAALTASLKGGDYVEDVFYPDRQVCTSFDRYERIPLVRQGGVVPP